MSGQCEWEWGSSSGGWGLSRAYLEDGVISVLAGAVPCGMAPGDVEEFPFAIDPSEPWVLATVHLGHQPGLQPHTAGWRGDPEGRLVHGKGVCRRKTEGCVSRFAANHSFGRGMVGRGGLLQGPSHGVRTFSSSQHWGLESLQSIQVLKASSLPNHQLSRPGSLHLRCVWGEGKEGVTL